MWPEFLKDRENFRVLKRQTFLSVAQQPNSSLDRLIVVVSRSHTIRQTDTRQDSSERVIGSSQRPLPDNTQHSQQTDIHAAGGIRTHDLSRRAAADLRLRPRGQWDRPIVHLDTQIQNAYRVLAQNTIKQILTLTDQKPKQWTIHTQTDTTQIHTTKTTCTKKRDTKTKVLKMFRAKEKLARIRTSSHRRIISLGIQSSTAGSLLS